jgi:phage terminase small subunit
MASPDDITKLRRVLGEQIPENGSEADTLFKDVDLSQLIDDAPDLDRAALDGWREKAAALSNLVDTTEGNSQKKFSQLLNNALNMVKAYSRSSTGPTEGRTRVGRIRRDPVKW